jgi:hypothetical protein
MTGTLPSELSMIGTTIVKISIEKNLFVGTIPNSYGSDMVQLSSLSLQVNGITGSMPSELCPNDKKNTITSMEDLKADCEEIECYCCTECFIDPATDPKRDTNNFTTTIVDAPAAAASGASGARTGGSVRGLLRRT